MRTNQANGDSRSGAQFVAASDQRSDWSRAVPAVANRQPSSLKERAAGFAMGRLLALALLVATAVRGGSGPLATPEGYAVPQPGHIFSFPADHGAHPDFRIEWWYVTGHLRSEDARRFGFQATFFRLAGPRGGAPDPSPDFSLGTLYLAHMALTDVAGQRFLFEERLNREGWDAQAAVGALKVRNGTWSLQMAAGPTAVPAARRGAGQEAGPGAGLELVGGVRADAAFELELTPAKPLVVFGENGVSRKGAEATAASYYLTFSRLRAAGHLTFGGTALAVTGEAWMDHEISSSQLGGGQVGWDWVSVQLHDRPWELMLYRLRRADGSADPASRLQWVSPGGRAITADFTWEVLSRWRSPRTGATYPARVRLTTRDPATGATVRFTLEPLLADQELGGALGGGPYWEGACRVLDESGREVGSAYLELTGYAGALKL
jgi:predicted secreted hydrolase